jgi:hypothetical protein
MRNLSGNRGSIAASPPRKSKPSEQVDEAQGLIESERVEVEREIPLDDNQSVERVEPHERPDPPVFED